MSIEYRLVEWGLWLREPPRTYFPPVSPMFNERAGRGGEPGDGGLHGLVDAFSSAMFFDSRAREVHRVVVDLPHAYRAIVVVTYRDTPPRCEITPVRIAAALLDLPVARYRECKTAVLAWIAGRLCVPLGGPVACVPVLVRTESASISLRGSVPDSDRTGTPGGI